jgi:DNA-binding SARP family transcriptional activator
MTAVTRRPRASRPRTPARSPRANRRQPGSILRAAAAFLVLIFLTVVLPGLLYAAAGPPLPAQLRDPHRIAGLLARPDDGALFLDVIRGLSWLAWAAFVLAVMIEILYQAAGRQTPKVLGFTLVQHLAGGLVASALAGFSGPVIAAAPAAFAATVPSHAHPAPGGITFRAPAPAKDAGIGPDPPTASPAAAAHVPPAAVFTVGLLTGGLLTTLGQLRHRQRQDRQPGGRIMLPASEAAQRAERTLRAAPAGQAGAPLRAAIAALSAGLRSAGRPLPPAAGVHITADSVDVLLTCPAGQPPRPFRLAPGTGDMCWRLDTTAVAGLLARNGPATGDLLPGLMTVGFTSNGHLLLDLESPGVTTVDGPDDLVDQMLTTAALELATNSWAGTFDLLLSGFPTLAAALPRALDCGGLDQAIQVLEQRAGELARIPSVSQPRQKRLDDPSCPDWTLTLLVARRQPTAEQMSRILAAAAPYSGLAAIVAGDPVTPDGREAAASIDLALSPAGNLTASIHPFDLVVCPAPLAAGDFRAIGEILAATLGADLPAGRPPYPPAPVALPGPSAVPGVVPGRLSSGLRITILGPFTITGAAESLQPKHAELLLALALARPSGLSMSALCTRLGAGEDQPKPPDSLRQIITRTRRRLGPAPGGRQYIQHAGNARYVLDEAAVLDWDEFRSLARDGREGRDRGKLAAALGLVHGVPLDDAFHWWIDLAVIEDIRAEVADTACLLAELSLEAGDPAAAARAARAGITADSSAEQVWRALMRAEDAAGNTAGVHEAWHRCLEIISDIAADGEPHPATTALYRQLTRRERVAAAR